MYIRKQNESKHEKWEHTIISAIRTREDGTGSKISIIEQQVMDPKTSIKNDDEK